MIHYRAMFDDLLGDSAAGERTEAARETEIAREREAEQDAAVRNGRTAPVNGAMPPSVAPAGNGAPAEADESVTRERAGDTRS